VEQRLGGQMADTTKYKKKGPYKLCFSNADVGNPWRVVGWTTMQAEVDLNKADIASFNVADAQGKDDKQISDIKAFVSSGNCDILIVSPNTTAALTPAVEDACKSLPVIVFDRGVRTTCPVTFVHPIAATPSARSPPTISPARSPRAARCWRCASCPASTCWRRAGPRPSASSTRRASRWWASNLPVATAPRRSRSSTTSRPLRQDRRRLDGRRRDLGRGYRGL